MRSSGLHLSFLRSGSSPDSSFASFSGFLSLDDSSWSCSQLPAETKDYSPRGVNYSVREGATVAMDYGAEAHAQQQGLMEVRMELARKELAYVQTLEPVLTQQSIAALLPSAAVPG